MYPNPILAFLFSFIPGLGHYYLNRKGRAFLYATGFFGAVCLAVLCGLYDVDDLAVMLSLVALGIWGINLLDALLYLLSPRRNGGNGQAGGYPPPPPQAYPPGYGADARYATDNRYASGYGDRPVPPHSPEQAQNERFYTILLSFVPGLGHFQLGLMQRGLTFLVSFFGLFALVAFVTFTTRVEGFLTFLLALPIIWLYGMFDAVQLVTRKQRGEVVEDRSLFEDLEMGREEGKRSRMVATLLSILPGAGHMYLGLQMRGIQLMAGFLISIYVMDTLHISLFLFLIPLIWFYALFDAFQTISKYGREPLRDKPIIEGLMTHQKWFGAILLALGIYYLFQYIGLDLVDRLIGDRRFSIWFYRYFQSFVVSLLLVAGGIKLLIGERKGKK
ncbi:hypothetical protein [Gorillibacterium timonense]|uniref:hypothetical protein n=1 Tax=Gorillibacterium timonense TaxID=1689269 RepID=UPI000A80DF6D|nr:hypothetical protein [Gorillibacterium timonense]